MRFRNEQKSSFVRNGLRALPALALAGCQLWPGLTQPNKVNNEPVALAQFYPDFGQLKAGYYLVGQNVASPDKPEPTVLWFQQTGDNSFRQYNSNPASPTATCHWDSMAQDLDGLNYYETQDNCGSEQTDIQYPEGIQLLPRKFEPGTSWGVNGKTPAFFYRAGRLACTGENDYSSRVVDSNNATITVEIEQITSWTAGHDTSGCNAGGETQWTDEYVLGSLPVAGTNHSSGALIRDVGGDTDRYEQSGQWDYDVRFSNWQQLPPAA